MSFHRRIHTIYAKELIDILRDRRTLTAMVVVPIVLYPLLMIGSIQAVSYQVESLDEEKMSIGVVAEREGRFVRSLIEEDREIIERQRSALDPESEAYQELGEPIGRLDIVLVEAGDVEGAIDELRRLIQERRVHVGVLLREGGPEASKQMFVELLADLEEVRGRAAFERVRAMFLRMGERDASTRLERIGLPATIMRPYVVDIEDLSAPQSILGQILPLILILMTITGAIYPAIDLTAGERERGTLESLMVCPVQVIDLIVGKFLVVTTVAILGATLNLASVCATVYFGGFDRVIASTGGSMPLGKMALILACLVPFAVLMSAIMIAVCSFARTFKEAQNYVTPVILAVLIPGGIAAMPTTRLSGIMLATPVANMVLLAREVLLGAIVPWSQIAIVLVSTSLYAAAAVAIAAKVFGRESVVFSDSGSLKSLLSRRSFRFSNVPDVSLALLVIAILFPIWFYAQSFLSPQQGEPATRLLFTTAWLMPLLFVLIPAGVLAFAKVSVVQTLKLSMPRPRYLLGGVLVGISAWIPAHELNVVQQALLGTPHAVIESAEVMASTLAELPALSVLLLIAVVPAISEELLFRGLLLSGLSRAMRKWPAILLSAAVFGVFHFFIFKFPVTAALGAVLAYLCWQSRSILPAIIAHLLHNGILALSVIKPDWREMIGLPAPTAGADPWVHFPWHILLIGFALFAGGLLLCRRKSMADAPASDLAVPAV